MDLVVSRGERRIWLRIDSDKDFPLSLADRILQDMAFPDEETYAEALRLGPVKKLTLFTLRRLTQVFSEVRSKGL